MSDALILDIEPEDPRAALRRAARAVSEGAYGVWWVSATQIALDPEGAIEPLPGEDTSTVHGWALAHLEQAHAILALLTNGEPIDPDNGETDSGAPRLLPTAG